MKLFEKLLIIILISLVICSEMFVYSTLTIDEDSEIDAVVNSDSMGQFVFDIVCLIAII